MAKNAALVLHASYFVLSRHAPSLLACHSDACMQESERQTWSELKAAVDHMLQSSQGTIAEFSHDALRELRAASIAVEDVEGRPKSLRSICSKLRRKGDGSLQVRPRCQDMTAAPSHLDCQHSNQRARCVLDECCTLLAGRCSCDWSTSCALECFSETESSYS